MSDRSGTLSSQFVKTYEDEKQSGGFFSDPLYHDRTGIAPYIHAKRNRKDAAEKTAAVVRPGLKPIRPAPMPVEMLLRVSAAAKIAPSFMLTLPVQSIPAENGSSKTAESLEKKVFLRAGVSSGGPAAKPVSGLFLRTPAIKIQIPIAISNKAPRRPALLGRRSPEMAVPKSIDKSVPLLLQIAIRRFSDKGMHMFLRP